MMTKSTRILGDLATRRAGGLRAAALVTVTLGALGGCAFFGLPETSSAQWEYCRTLDGAALLEAIERNECAPAAGGLAMRADEERERYHKGELKEFTEPVKEPTSEPEDEGETFDRGQLTDFVD